MTGEQEPDSGGAAPRPASEPSPGGAVPKGPVVRLIVKIDSVAPGLRPRFQTAAVRASYWGLSVLLRNDETAFLNYGYAPLDAAATALELDPGDEPDRVSIQLYNRVAGARDLDGKDVLEVGCGRGGGASYMARYLRPASMTGIDLSARAVRYCRRRHPTPRLIFRRGDAGHLPFVSASFDAVVNVESSHGYPSFERFVDEVARVLRPGGLFLFADFRPRDAIGPMREQLASRFTVVEEELITPNVLRASELDSDRRAQLIERRVPRFMQRNVSTFAGVQGTPVFDAFVSGELQYIRFVLEKAAA